MSYNSCGAPVLDNYAQARAHYESVKPIRKKDVRPLGNRRWYHQSSISMDGDNVVLNYYNGPAVIWHPDDSITVMMPRYASAYEPEKMAHYLPPGLSYGWNERRLTLRNVYDGTEAILREGQPLRCVVTKPHESSYKRKTINEYATTGLVQEFEFNKRRGVSKRILKRDFLPFMDWAQVVTAISHKVAEPEYEASQKVMFTRVTGITYADMKEAEHWYSTTPWDEAHSDKKRAYTNDQRLISDYPMAGSNSWRPRRFHRAGVEFMLNVMRNDDAEGWVDALNIIAGNHGQRRYNRDDTYHVSFEVTAKHIEGFIERLICAGHASEVFERTALPLGRVPKRRYVEFTRPASLQYFTEKTDSVSESSI